MKKVYLVSLGILLVAALILGGSAQPAHAWKWPPMLKVVTHGTESPPYQATIGWGAIMEKKTGMKVRVTPEMLAPLRILSVREGKYHMNANSAGDASYGMMGISTFATREGGPHQGRILWLLETVPFGVMVRGDADIKTISDLKPGVSFAVPPGPAPLSDVYGVAAWAGLMKDEVKIVNFGDMESAVRAVPEGKADCVWWTPVAGISFEMVGTPHGVRWLEMDPKKDPKGAARALEKKPLWYFAKAPPGVAKPAEGVTMCVMVTYYYVMEDTDPELTYHLAKWFDENHGAYKGTHPSCQCMGIDNFTDILDTAPFPVHRGVIKYLKEKGMWTADDDKRQAYNVELVTKYVRAYKAAITAADKRGIKVDPKNKDWMNLWAEHKKGIPIFKIMTEIP